MQISRNWLSELLPELNLSTNALAETLTAIGLEVESVHEFAPGLEPLRVVEVQEVKPHPERGKLQLVTVSLGGGVTQTVVCGARNVPKPGGLVVLAPLGTKLVSVGIKLEPRKIGGVLSEGMLCSEAELGLAETSHGILTLEAGRFAPGTSFLEAFPGTEDTIYTIGVTPNRPDALGHIGVARDLSAALKLDLKLPSPPNSKQAARTLDEVIEVDNQAPTAAPRYGAAAVEGVTIAPSPEWLRWRLFSLGVRPIANVVDVTNLVLLEYGNPMHAFDLKRVRGGRIVIRHAKPQERMTTLDEVERELLATDLVIGDAERPAALAGVMGGADSEIRQDTRDVLLEAAYFEPTGIRRTSRRLGLQTDSSFRFERGVNWGALESVLTRASQLIAELGNGAVLPGQRFQDGTLPSLPIIELDSKRVNALLGIDVDFSEALDLLARLGFEIIERSATQATVRGAAWRPDVHLEADLIEEIARIRGFDEIPTELPAIVTQPPSEAGLLERKVRRLAAQLGLSEGLSYTFVSRAALSSVKAPEPIVSLTNPLHEERDVMCTSLLPGLLESIQKAQRHGEDGARLFSVGARFLPPHEAPQAAPTQAARPLVEEDLRRLPEERLSFAAVLAGHRPAYLSKPDEYDVYDAKGIAVGLIEGLTNRAVEVRRAGPEVSHLHPRAAGELFVEGTSVGCFGRVHPDVADALELHGSVFVVELDLSALERVGKVVPRYRPIPRLPAITRDIALSTPTHLEAGTLQQAIETSAGELCESVELFDLFHGPPGSDSSTTRSLAFRVTYRDPKAAFDPERAKTLTDKQVDAQHRRVIEAVTKLGAVHRA